MITKWKRQLHEGAPAGLARSSVYYRPLDTDEADLKLVTAIDLVHTELPFYGARRIRDELIARGFTPAAAAM